MYSESFYFQDILKHYRFDLPVGIEQNHADWAKVINAAKNAFTQIRSSIKKELCHSTKADDSTVHLNIYNLTEHIIQKTNCKISVPLCARIALMRSVYLEDSLDKFWNILDSHLAHINEKASTAPTVEKHAEKIIKAFSHILKLDREKHGPPAMYELEDDMANDFQRQIDETIESTINGLSHGGHGTSHRAADAPAVPSTPAPHTPARSVPNMTPGAIITPSSSALAAP
ncbi:hypothetical protein A0H81_05602 [Grifola frondosa]|uniref:Uncharacterized protein n=1 Tax=Grifola frondosa TaxID=5627 RepID=A0A1C7MDV1_GRIFR|nr:hypothetical protein A0H81_05602 [Grifola frondosa]